MILIALFVAVVLSVDLRMSQTFDEGFHLVAGYRYLQCGDFGMNTEHPPLVKMVAALPLHLTSAPAPSGGKCGIEPTTKDHGYKLGVSYLYKQGMDAQKVLFLARAVNVLFAVLLMTVVFLYARYLFSYWVAILALLLTISEPTLIAHGGLVTTDMAVSAGVLLAVFMLDRFLQRPTLGRILMAGVSVGFALAAKHSGVIIVPIVIALMIADRWIGRDGTPRRTLKLGQSAGALGLIFLIAIGFLWSTYAFRYWPRPSNIPMTLSLADFLTQVRAQGTTGFLTEQLIPFAARWHLLPMGYLYGLVDVLSISYPGLHPFLLGRLLPHGVWYYFPITFLIKSTPAFIALLVVALCRGEWLNPGRRRAFFFLLIPAAIWYSIAMTSGLDIGYRHVLPTVAFLAIFISAGISYWARRTSNTWRAILGILVLTHLASAMHAYPNFLPYANELLGGQRKIYKYLTDSNNDWGQALLATSKWLKAHRINDCWIAYDGAADLAYYGIPCRVLPGNPDDKQAIPPPEATGFFIISSLSYAGVEWEPGELHPYKVFHVATPANNLDGAMLFYNGTFNLRPVQAVSLTIRAATEIGTDPSAALRDAQAALTLTPTSVRARLIEAHALQALGQQDAAKQSFTAALQQAERTGTAWYTAQIAEAKSALDAISLSTKK